MLQTLLDLQVQDCKLVLETTTLVMSFVTLVFDSALLYFEANVYSGIGKTHHLTVYTDLVYFASTTFKCHCSHNLLVTSRALDSTANKELWKLSLES